LGEIDKINDRIAGKMPQLSYQQNEAVSYGDQKLQEFHTKTQPGLAAYKKQFFSMRKQQFEFMRDCCNMAQLYVTNIQKRLDR
jgi:ubiquitin